MSGKPRTSRRSLISSIGMINHNNIIIIQPRIHIPYSSLHKFPLTLSLDSSQLPRPCHFDPGSH